MSTMKWLEKKFYSIVGVGVFLVLLFWIALSSKNLTAGPPKNYLNLNPPRRHVLPNDAAEDGGQGRGRIFRQNLLQPLGNAMNEHDEDPNSKPENVMKLEDPDRKENLLLIKEQLKMSQKLKLGRNLLLPMDGQQPKNIQKTETKHSAAIPISNISLDYQGFQDALKGVADRNKTVILSIVDESFVDFAVNFYKGSIIKNDIRNFLLVCFDRSSYNILEKHNITCFHLDLSINLSGNNSTVFGSASYYAKTNIKTYATLCALRLGYNVLIVDVDVVLFRNPLPYIVNDSPSSLSLLYDIYISSDRVHRNTGFMLVRSNNHTVAVFSKAWDLFLTYHQSHDQAYIGRAIDEFITRKQITVQQLSNTQFPNGYYYFQYDKRFFRNQPFCKECVIAHNNYVGTAEAKKYRFKENGLWAVDTDGYYSDPQAIYIVYDNPSAFKSNAWHEEMQALHNALYIGSLSDRIVVLPTFHCCDCSKNVCASHRNKCSLMHMLDVRLFDAQYKTKYREHVFFDHPYIPDRIKSDLKKAPVLSITVSSDKVSESSLSNQTHFSCLQDHCDKKALKTWLRRFDDFSVIHLLSLYGKISGNFSTNASIKCGNYEQWRVKP